MVIIVNKSKELNISLIRESEEFAKEYKKIYESLLDEFKGDYNIHGIELTVDNNGVHGAVYIEVTVTNGSAKDIIDRVKKYLHLGDRVLLSLFVEHDNEYDSKVYMLGMENHTDVLHYELMNDVEGKGYIGRTDLKYLNLSYYYGEESRYYSYHITNKVLYNRLDSLFKGYEYEDYEEYGI